MVRRPPRNDLLIFLKKTRESDSVLSRLRRESGAGTLEWWDFHYTSQRHMNQVDRHFPVDSQLPFLRATLKDLGLDLLKLPIYLDITEDSTAPPHAKAIPIDPPRDVRVSANLTDGLLSFKRLMNAVGLALLYSEVRQDSPLFRNLRNTTQAEAIGRFFESFCFSPDWLRKYTHMPESLIERVRQGQFATDILNARLLLVNVLFEREIYRNPNRDLNALYWDLLIEHTNLPRYDDLVLWTSETDLPEGLLISRDHLFAQIAAAQTWAYIAQQHGSVVGNREVRSFMVQNYFRFGNRYPWEELVERATDEPLSVIYLLE